MKNKVYLLIMCCFLMITALQAQQDIEVTLNDVVLTSGVSSFDFGNVMIDFPASNVAVVENVGDATLMFDVANAVTLSGTDASEFSLVASISSTLTAGSNVGISISLSPTTPGVKTATVSIGSDDPDEDPFTFVVTGTALAKPADCVIPIMDMESFYKGSMGQIDFGTGQITGVTNYTAPSGWTPLIAQLFAVFGQNINVSETADARTGSSALELFSDGTGIADLFTIIPCGSYPASLTGYYKFSGGIGESATITISTGGGDEENRTEGNTSTLTISSEAATYTSFQMDFEYDANSVDSLFFYLAASSGSSLSFIIDDLAITPGTGLPGEPFAPNPVTFSDLTTTSLTVNWEETNDHGSAVTGYTLQEKAGAAGSYTTVYTGTNMSYNAIGLITGETYYYQVLATNAEGDSDFSEEAEVIPANLITMTSGTASACDGLFVDSGGTSGNYSNGENITFTLAPDIPGDLVSISFISFDVENCCDQLLVYDGPNAGSPLLATLKGLSIPSDLVATGAGGELTFVFTSDGSDNFEGWQANVSCVTPALAPPNKPVPVTFSNVSADEATVNWIAPGDNGSAITGYTLDQKEGLAGSYSTVYTGTDLSYTATGLTEGETYYFKVKATNSEGDSDFSDEAGVLTSNDIFMSNTSVSTCDALFFDSGESTGNYADDEDLTLTIQPDTQGDVVSISFTSFDLEDGWDYLYVYDGPNTSSSLIATLTGISIPADIIASGSGGELTFNFVSDGSTTGEGWEATVSCMTPPYSIPIADDVVSTCDALFFDSGESSGDYLDDEDFTLTVEPETQGGKVRVSFSSFDVEDGWDYLYVYDGPNTSSSLIATLTGTSTPTDIVASGSGGELTFNFVSDGSNTNSGWEATISCDINTTTWNGSSWDNGDPNEGIYAIIEGNYTGVGFVCPNLDVGLGFIATITSGTLDVKGEVFNDGSIIIASGSSLITYEANTISGNDITIKRNTRYTDGKYSFVGSPVEQNANTTATTLGSNVYYYDEFQPYSDNDGLDRWQEATGELVPGTGYTQTFQQEIVFEGTPNTGTITYSGQYTGTYNDATDEATEGWNLVSNPYPAAINVGNFLTENINIEGAVYIWDDNGSATIRGSNSDYIAANGTVAINTTAAGGQTRYNQHLGSAQGFFVKLASDSDLDIEFTETMRMPDNNEDDNFFRKAEEEISYVRINLTDDKGLFKQTVLGWMDDISDTEVDRKFDARVFNSNADYSIYTLKADQPLAIQGITYQKEEIPLGLNIGETGSYRLEIDTENYHGEPLYLKDHQTEEVFDLTREAYDFTTESGQIKDRFTVLTINEVLALEIEKSAIYTVQKTLHIEALRSQQVQYQLYNLSGKHVMSILSNGTTKVDLSFLTNGIYLVSDGIETKKIVLK